MAKLTKSLYHKLSQIIFGSVLSGILMFQGTGFITSNLYAANVNVDVTGGATIDNRENNTGLT
ncbi:MAG: hypothetical protein IKW74_06500, partial [Thermoguttaceae bacterium]|nr:hypothetical protein [Thermoguttaceae bacterium]